MLRSVTITSGLLLLATSAYAECDPKVFLQSDVEKLDYSSYLGIAAYDFLERSSSTDKSRRLEAGAIVEGVPLKLGFDDAQKLSSFVRQQRSIKISQDQKLSYLKVALSSTGAKAYEACLRDASETIKVEIPSHAFTDELFQLKVTWTPTRRLDANRTGMSVSLANATIAGKEDHSGEISAGEEQVFAVRRDLTEPVSLSVTIDGKAKLAYLPPYRPIKAKLVSRELPMATGTWPGNTGRKELTECIAPTSPESLLLLSTAAISKETKESKVGGTRHVSSELIYLPKDDPRMPCLKLISDAAGDLETHDWHIDVLLTADEIQLLP